LLFRYRRATLLEACLESFQGVVLYVETDLSTRLGQSKLCNVSKRKTPGRFGVSFDCER
jgi:hypothetical protein